MSGPKIKYRANNDWLLESKTDMKARGLRSSDLSDACALTFALPNFLIHGQAEAHKRLRNGGSADDRAQ
jgi:hypothetical protein